VRLSVLDLVPVRADQSSPDALAATVRLGRLADRLGFTRYWIAEHHNVPSVAATSPAVLIGVLAAQTSRLRIGSGGVMLPNHAPLAVAEQFAMLEAAYPGRIDLGIGRAPGADPVVSTVLRGGHGDRAVDAFPDHIDDVVALLGAAGVSLQLADHRYVLRSTPRAVSVPPVFLLGSSMYSAQLAAAKGLPYVFGHHLFGTGTAEALARYRSEFAPDGFGAGPEAFLTVNIVVAETREEAAALLLPSLHVLARTATGESLGPIQLVEDAQQTALTPRQQQIVQDELRRAVLGTPAEAVAQLRELADRFEVDELMLNPVASARRGTDPTTAPAREATLELLVDALS
jgi:luciferase family oxidoreductase group 1